MTRRSLAVVALVAAVLVLAWFVLLWRPKGEELAAARERQEQAEVRLDELEARLARLQATRERLPALQASLDRLRSAVPDEPALAQFILDTNSAAGEAGVEFVSIAPQEPAPSTTGGPTEVALAIDVSGGYFEVLDFLDRLAAMPRIVVVDSFTATPTETAAGQAPNLSISLAGRMFTRQLLDVPGQTTPTTTVAVTR